MRKIKFRAWSIEEEKIFYPSRIDLVSSDEHWIWDDADKMYHPDVCVLMQYTGLHDKNGKEIYEGDVVKVGLGRYEVAYGEGSFESHFGYIGVILKGACEESVDLDRALKWEIIGNIYENPELMV